MAGFSNIEWTEITWNPVTGCSKVSPGCKFCYAERFAQRLQKMGNKRYTNGFNVKMHWDLIDYPRRLQKPSLIFVNSMSDLFHEEVSDEFIMHVFKTLNYCQWHHFQILTKRSARLAEIARKLKWTPNIWIGVSVESQGYTSRITNLLNVPAKIRFVSAEPLIGPIGEIPLKGLHWVIVGGESGPNARPMKLEWVEMLRMQCENAKVPFFFKQWGGSQKWKTGRKLNGKIYNQMPIAMEELGFFNLSTL